MIVKRIAALAGAGALLLSVASPAFADDDLRIRNRARVRNWVTTSSNSGLNVITAGEDVEGGKIKTGAADAYSEVNNVVNTNTVDDCGCFDDVTIRNKAKVKNTVDTSANTGLNVITASDDVEGGRIRTGGALSTSVVTNVVNTNVVD